MKSSFTLDFEKKVLDGLCRNEIDISENSLLKIGAAVSGGADSLSLLFSLAELSKSYGFSLFVITVNHNIRPSEETAGDAEYVLRLCKMLENSGVKIIYECVEVERGEIFAAAEERGCGVEEAARFYRYGIFEDFINKHKLDCLALAHNKNDQLETLLMRFLQGSFTESSTGISSRRELYVRPLLDIERKDIEQYLKCIDIEWRTDSTNSDVNYLRNKIRLKLVPFLNKEFMGWQTGVEAGLEKALLDSAIIEKEVEKITIVKSEDCCYINKNDFFNCPDGIKVRLLLKMCNRLGEKQRIPFVFLKDVIKTFNLKQNSDSKIVRKYFGAVVFELEKENIFVKKSGKMQTDLIFSDIIEDTGEFLFPFGKLNVNKISADCFELIVNDCEVVKGLKLPVCIRNVRADDEVETKDGAFKKISDIFADWHVDEEHKALIPVVQNLMSKNQEIICILGCVYGFNNWIVNRWIEK